MVITDAPPRPAVKKLTVKEWLKTKLNGRTTLKWGEMTDLAAEFGCSRERVRQVLRRNMELELESKKNSLFPCGSCGKSRMYRGKMSSLCADCSWSERRVSLTCRKCGKKFNRGLASHARYVAKYGKRRGHRGPFCSRPCMVARIVTPCAWCGKDVDKPRSHSKSRFLFCDRECQSKILTVFHPTRWNKIQSYHLPMQDHMDEIAIAVFSV
jgi:hypothetical protein